MKANILRTGFVVFLAVFVTFSGFCQRSVFDSGFILKSDKARSDREAEERRMHEAEARIEDPWRVVNGRTNCIWKDAQWISVMASRPAVEAKGSLALGCFAFSGRVLSVHQNGIVVDGYCGDGRVHSGAPFFVANFPYAVAEGDSIGLSAAFVDESRPIERFNIAMGTKTLHRLDYGLVCDAPTVAPRVFTPAEIAAAKAAADGKAKQNAAKALAFNQSQADKGDAQGEFRMGERYLIGEGVAKDPQVAREWFAKAAAQGHSDAKAALEKLGTVVQK
jgi:hypothetical protein